MWGKGETNYDCKCKRNVWLNGSGGNSPKSVWWNDEVKPAVMTKEAAWREVLTGV